MDDLLQKCQQPAYMQTAHNRPNRPNMVNIDNDVSVDCTVIDIFATDKVGLLYDISRTLKDLGLYIEVSKISTKVDQAADVFYVRDIFGQKIIDVDKIAEIRNTLLKNLG